MPCEGDTLQKRLQNEQCIYCVALQACGLNGLTGLTGAGDDTIEITPRAHRPGFASVSNRGHDHQDFD